MHCTAIRTVSIRQVVLGVNAALGANDEPDVPGWRNKKTDKIPPNAPPNGSNGPYTVGSKGNICQKEMGAILLVGVFDEEKENVYGKGPQMSGVCVERATAKD